MSGIIDFLIFESVGFIFLRISDLLTSLSKKVDSLLISNIIFLIVSSKTWNSYSDLMLSLSTIDGLK